MRADGERSAWGAQCTGAAVGVHVALALGSPVRFVSTVHGAGFAAKRTGSCFAARGASASVTAAHLGSFPELHPVRLSKPRLWPPLRALFDNRGGHFSSSSAGTRLAGSPVSVRSVGAGAVTESTFMRPLLHVAGESAGGVLTPTDFRSITDVDVVADTVTVGATRWVVAPWAHSDAAEPVSADFGTGHAVCAVDVRGLFAVLSYRRVMNGVLVDELELEAPPIAVPVLRGVSRVAPGKPLPAPAPIAIRVDEAGVPIEVLAAPSAAAPTEAALATAKLRVRWDAEKRRAEIVR